MRIDEQLAVKIYTTINSIFKVNFIIDCPEDKEIIRLNDLDLPSTIKEDEIKMIKQLSDYPLLKNKNTVCYYETNRKLKYIIFGVNFENIYQGNIIIGPYINYPVLLGIKSNEGKQIDKTIPIIKIVQEKAIENIVISMLNSDIKSSNTIIINENIGTKKDDKDYYIKEFDMSIMNIRERYKLENKLLHYVSIGDKDNALEVVNNINDLSFERFPDNPIRGYKNFAISMNTLLRKAVQENNIDPYFLDSISDDFAKKVESTKEIEVLRNIFNEMIKAYCNLVEEYKTKGYSKLISSAINFIKLNYKYEISLSTIAKELFVHPTYLSKKFKLETETNISDYINEIRVREAGIMLKTTEFKIEDIAYYVGYNDKKYFSKMFKKFYNQSPSEYRKYS